MVSLTGSYNAGAVMRSASENITKVSLELGGKAPAIVMDDADIDLAVRSIVASRVINTGQVCNYTERVYVHEKVADEFIKKVVKAMEQIKYGNSLVDENPDMGPLARKDALESVEKMVQKAVANGAKVLTGGKRSTREKG